MRASQISSCWVGDGDGPVTSCRVDAFVHSLGALCEGVTGMFVSSRAGCERVASGARRIAECGLTIMRGVSKVLWKTYVWEW